MSLSISKTSDPLSFDSLLVLTRTAFGLGLGMLMADLKHDYVQTFVRELAETTGAQIADAFAALEGSASSTLREEGAKPEQIVLRRFLDMRYRGQEYTLTVPRTVRLDEIKLINGQLDVNGVSGEVRASCINGRLEAENGDGKMLGRPV